MKTILPLFKGLGSLCAFLLLFSGSLFAQTTVTIGPGTVWTDAMLYKSYQNLNLENTNLHDQNRNLASAWTSGGQNTFFRTLFRFNLSSIPSGAVIQSATLYLYSDLAVTTAGPTSNSPYSGSNAVYFEKVASNWGETTVTWNNQPATTTTTGRIWQAASTSTTENIPRPDIADMGYYIQAYSELRRASLSTSTLTSTKALRYRIKQLQDAGITPISIIAYKFNFIDTLALQDGLLYQSNGLYYDSSPRSRSPFKQKTMVLAAALTETVKVGTAVRFEVTSDLAVENLTADISSISVDAGSGPVTYTVGQQFNYVFNSTGQRMIKLVVRLSNGASYTTLSAINVVTDPSACQNCRLPEQKPCKPTETFYTDEDEKFQGYDESTPIPGVGEVSYYYADCSSPILRNPIIIMDGFDPGDEMKGPALFNQQLSYDKANGDEANLARDLRAEGYDILVLNFPANKFLDRKNKPMHAGADFIERNAMALVHLIKQVNAELAKNGSTAQLIVVGPSMGGLISKYALAYMEKKQRENPTVPE